MPPTGCAMPVQPHRTGTKKADVGVGTSDFGRELGQCTCSAVRSGSRTGGEVAAVCSGTGSPGHLKASLRRRHRQRLNTRRPRREVATLWLPRYLSVEPVSVRTDPAAMRPRDGLAPVLLRGTPRDGEEATAPGPGLPRGRHALAASDGIPTTASTSTFAPGVTG